MVKRKAASAALVLTTGIICALIFSKPAADAHLQHTALSSMGDIEAPLLLSGTIEAQQVYAASFPVSGCVSQIDVQEGAKVKPGDMLMRLDDTLIKDQISMVEAEQEAQKLKMQLSAKDWEILEQNALSVFDGMNAKDLARMNDALSDLTQAVGDEEAQSVWQGIDESLSSATQSSAAQSIQQLQLLELKRRTMLKQQEQYALKSTISGTVSRIQSLPGSYVIPGQTVVTVTSDARVARVTALQNNVSRLRLGQEASIYIAESGETLTTTVARVQSAVSAQSGATAQMVVEFDLDEMRSKGYLEGTAVKATVVLDRRENVVKLPLECLYEREGESFVCVVQADGSRQWVKIETGLQDDFYIEVISGLAPGERLVLYPDENGQANIPAGRLSQ